jgi:hypothetical protein
MTDIKKKADRRMATSLDMLEICSRYNECLIDAILPERARREIFITKIAAFTKKSVIRT